LNAKVSSGPAPSDDELVLITLTGRAGRGFSCWRARILFEVDLVAVVGERSEDLLKAKVSSSLSSPLLSPDDDDETMLIPLMGRRGLIAKDRLKLSSVLLWKIESDALEDW